MKFKFERDWDSWADYHRTRVWRAVAARYGNVVAQIVHYSNGFSYTRRYQCAVGNPISPAEFETDNLHEAVSWLQGEMSRRDIANLY